MLLHDPRAPRIAPVVRRAVLRVPLVADGRALCLARLRRLVELGRDGVVAAEHHRHPAARLGAVRRRTQHVERRLGGVRNQSGASGALRQHAIAGPPAPLAQLLAGVVHLAGGARVLGGGGAGRRACEVAGAVLRMREGTDGRADGRRGARAGGIGGGGGADAGAGAVGQAGRDGGAGLVGDGAAEEAGLNIKCSVFRFMLCEVCRFFCD